MSVVRVRAWASAAYSALWLTAVVITWALVLAMVPGCGAAGRVSSAVACSSLMLTIGETRTLEPERAVADIEAVSAVCRRLDAADAGAP